MNIRAYDPNRDYQAVRALWRMCAPGIQISSTDDDQGLRKKLDRNPELFLVATEEQNLIGSVIGGYDGRRGLVYHLAVAPDQRRQGIAQSLMTELEERLTSLGCYKYYLLVTRENDGALAFYRSIDCELMDLHVLGKVLR